MRSDRQRAVIEAQELVRAYARDPNRSLVDELIEERRVEAVREGEPMATKLKTRASELYEQDFVLWTEDQAAALRAGRLDALDLENLAEEIASLGGRDRRELDSRLEVLVMHLLKWRYQSDKRTGSWESTIRTQRREIEKLIRQSPSLRREVEPMMLDGYRSARRNAAAETDLGVDTFPEACPFSEDQVLADEWLPAEHVPGN